MNLNEYLKESWGKDTHYIKKEENLNAQIGDYVLCKNRFGEYRGIVISKNNDSYVVENGIRRFETEKILKILDKKEYKETLSDFDKMLKDRGIRAYQA